MRTSRKTDFRSRDIAKNNFSGIDISQGMDLELPSPYFLLLKDIKTKCLCPLFCVVKWSLLGGQESLGHAQIGVL